MPMGKPSVFTIIYDPSPRSMFKGSQFGSLDFLNSLIEAVWPAGMIAVDSDGRTLRVLYIKGTTLLHDLNSDEFYRMAGYNSKPVLVKVTEKKLISLGLAGPDGGWAHGVSAKERRKERKEIATAQRRSRASS